MQGISVYLGAIVRHVVTTVGGGFVAEGALTGDDLNVVAGAAAIIAGLLWSFVQKKLAK